MVVHAYTQKSSGITRNIITSMKLGIPSYLNNGVPQVTEGLKALWDTGATGSVISVDVVNKIGLKPISASKATGISGVYDCNKYIVDIILPNNVLIPDVFVIDSKDMMGFDVIIGMNIINLGDFAISNKDKKTVFSFQIPSVLTLDFVLDGGKILNLLREKVIPAPSLRKNVIRNSKKKKKR